MTSLLVAFVFVLLAPLFLATWRSSVVGLALQGALMGWIAYRSHHDLSLASILTLTDLIGLRALLAPSVLYYVLRQQNAPPRNDVIPPNMIYWSIAIALVVMAFRFAGRLVPLDGDQQMLVAVSAAGILLGLLVLASKTSPLAQMIGVLRIENAISLFELGAQRHVETVVIRVGQMVILAISIAMFAWYLRTLHPDFQEPTAERPPL